MKYNIDLTHLNTFQVKADTSYYIDLNGDKDLEEVLAYVKSGQPYFILGGGANILILEDFNGLVIKNNLKGIKVLDENKDFITFQVASGEDWHSFVEFAVSRNLSGIENLAYIPGTVGAAVVQNIAAYGQHFEDVMVGVEVVNLTTGERSYFSKDDCRFNYRNSVFKDQAFRQFLLVAVDIRLSKTPKFSTNYQSRYESLQSELVGKEPPYSVHDIFEAVISLRKKKLPDWHLIGTAGSFFKNPVVSKSQFMELSEKVKELQFYPVSRLEYDQNPELLHKEMVKIPAGRLLDELGWKGKRLGNVGTFERSALVVINHGNATGKEILAFTKEMEKDVKDHYGIDLEREVFVLHN